MHRNIMLKIGFYFFITMVMGSSQTVMFIDPPVIPTMTPGDTFWISINVADVVNLYEWQAYVRFNPQICTVLIVTDGPFMKREEHLPRLFLI